MDTHVSKNPTPTQADHAVSWKGATGFILIVVLMSLAPLAAAGRFDWWQGWVYSLILMGTNFLSRYLVFRRNPELLAERFRLTTVPGIKNWDKLLAPFIGIVGPLLVFIVAGLDKRNGWSPDVSLPPQIVAVVLLVLSGAFGTWAMLENPFFTAGVRIQKDRGQTVITTGPYHFIRHPAYSENVLWWLVTPVILGSLWAFVPAAIQIVFLIVRTALEDRTLQAELPGYRDYAQRTRYRLLPFIW